MPGTNTVYRSAYPYLALLWALIILQAERYASFDLLMQVC
jgi:hypothetical protein